MPVILSSSGSVGFVGIDSGLDECCPGSRAPPTVGRTSWTLAAIPCTTGAGKSNEVNLARSHHERLPRPTVELDPGEVVLENDDLDRRRRNSAVVISAISMANCRPDDGHRLSA